MVGDPWIVGSNRQNGEIDRSLMSKTGECVGVRSVAGKEHRLGPFPKEVSTVSPMSVGYHACAPVTGFSSLDLQTVQHHALAPRKLVHVTESAHQITVPGLYHHRGAAGQQPQRAQIGVIHMGVRQENQVQRGQLTHPQGGLHQSSRSQFGEPTADTDPLLQRRIGKNPGATKIKEHRRMPQPRRRNRVIRP
jgi:hypothetical protein